MQILTRAFRYVRSLPWYWQVGGGVAILAVAVLGVNALTRDSSAAPTVSQTPHVRLASVASLSLQSTGPLPVTGTVESLNQATILAQSSGQVMVLGRSLGDYVPAGGVIAELENSSQRAAVLQAQGAYDAAQAAFANSSGTTAANSSITAAQTAQAVVNAEIGVNASMQSVYAAMDDAVRTKADQLFNDPRTNPRLLLSVSDSQLVITLQNQRMALEITLANAEALASASTRANVGADVTKMLGYSQNATLFLNNLVSALNKALPTDTVTASEITSMQASIGAARSTMSSVSAALSSAKTSYDRASADAEAARNTANQGTTNSISIAQANVEQAQGTLNAAKAALEKTIIRSPISGAIVSLPLTQGGFVTANTQVAQVSNPSALEVNVHVTPQDAKTLAIGGKAQIGDLTEGVIVSIAPALDPTTGKILVKLGIVGSQAALTDGDTVSVTLSRSTAAQVAKAGSTPKQILIPIVAAKITPQGPAVFTLTASSTLAQVPITLGTILGDQVVVLSGLTPDMVIVTDARSLSHGQTVIVE